MTGARPSTRDSKIVIEFGGTRKDSKSKKYPMVTVSNKAYKRSSLGATSVTSNEGAIESPGSEASYTMRTGFADVSVPPTDHSRTSQTYRTRHDVPAGHYRQTSSSVTSSQPPSLYATSDAESPAASARQLPSYPRTIVHNPLPGVAPSSPNTSRAPVSAPAPASPQGHRIRVATPRTSSRDNIGADGLTPLDYSDFVDQSASSHASSSRAAAPEITDRAADREQRRKQKEDDRKRQEEADRRYAEELDKQEEAKQVRFDLGRAEDRTNQRAEQKIAESEKRRAEERDDARRRKKDHEQRPPTKKPEREKTKPPTRDFTRRPGGHSRRSSMTQADIDEMNRLRLQEEAQMAREREATEIRERNEQTAALRQQQQASDYWDPRGGGDRYPIPNASAGVGRRGSVSSRRPSITGNLPPMGGLGRSNSTRRVSIIQAAPPPNPPALTTQFSPQQQYSTRPPSSHYQNPPTMFSPSSYTSSSRPPSARHPSNHEIPFAQPPTRTSHTNLDTNPFTLPPTRPVHPSHPPHDHPFAVASSALAPHETGRDRWDGRELRDALPRTNQHHTLQRRGDGDERRAHGRAQQATRNLETAQGYEDEYESSNEEDEERKLAGKGARMGVGKSRRPGY